MPVLAMAQPVVDHRKRFQAAVDVIHNLPKNGTQPSHYLTCVRRFAAEHTVDLLLQNPQAAAWPVSAAVVPAGLHTVSVQQNITQTVGLEKPSVVRP